MDCSIAGEESPAPATKKTLLKSRVFSFFVKSDLRVPEVRLRAHPVDDTASKTKRCGQKLPTLQVDSNFWVPQEVKQTKFARCGFKVSAAASVGASVLCTEVSTGHPHPAPATKMETVILVMAVFVFS